MNAQRLTFTPAELEAVRRIVAAGLEEDLGTTGDRTTGILIDAAARGKAALVARRQGVVAGLPAAELTFRELDHSLSWRARVSDGHAVATGSVLAELEGSVRALLSAERVALNILSHLSGIATLTRQYVEAVAGTRAQIYDTRKTLPGWRLLEKYAVRAGGGCNHRLGLGDAVLVKDNHLAALAQQGRSSGAARRRGGGSLTGPAPPTTADRPAGSSGRWLLVEAVARAKENLKSGIPLIVEVETLEQLADVLAARPEIVLLDNMDVAGLRRAVAVRDRLAPQVLLEASGGINLDNVRAVAETGVERISIGALTHSAPALDIAMDFK